MINRFAGWFCVFAALTNLASDKLWIAAVLILCAFLNFRLAEVGRR